MKLSPVQRNHILDLASIYGVATKTPHNQISIRAMGRDTFFARLILREDFADGEVQQFIKWMSDHWPRGVIWPDHVARPVAPVVEAA